MRSLSKLDLKKTILSRFSSRRAISPIIVMLILFMVMSVSAVVVWWYYSAILGGVTETARAASLSTLSTMEREIGIWTKESRVNCEVVMSAFVEGAYSSAADFVSDYSWFTEEYVQYCLDIVGTYGNSSPVTSENSTLYIDYVSCPDLSCNATPIG